MKSLLLLDLTGRVFLQKEKVLYWLISAFFISLFLPDMPVINNILIGATVLHACFYNSFAEKARLLKERKEVWMMILFYVWQILSAALSENRHEAGVMLVLRLPLLVFPLCIGLLFIREELKDRILLSYCFFTTIAAMACMIFAFYEHSRSGMADSLYDDNLTRAIGRPSVYVAIAVNLALFTYVYLLQKRSFAIQYKGLVFLSIAFLVVFHYMLASRIAIISLYAGFLVFAIWHYGVAKKMRTGILLVAFLLAGATGMIRFFPRTADRFRQLTPPGQSHSFTAGYDVRLLTPEQYNETNFRLPVWKSGWQLVREHPLSGIPLGDKEDKLMEVYKERRLDFALQTKLNMHNTYLDVLCNLGAIGLMVFLLGYLVLPLAAAWRMDDGLGLFIILTFAIAMCTETWPDRSIGCIMLGFFCSLASAWKRQEARA